MLEYIAQQEQQDVYMLGQRQLPESQVNIETGLPLIPIRDEITGMTVYFGLGSRSTGSDYEKVRRTDRELKKRYPNPFERGRRHLD